MGLLKRGLAAPSNRPPSLGKIEGPAAPELAYQTSYLDRPGFNRSTVPLSSQDYVGRYRLLNLIRTGKTCQVWEVMNDLSGDRLAMKLLLAEYRHDRQEVGYMKHEYEVGRGLGSSPGDQDVRVRHRSRKRLLGHGDVQRP